MATSTIVAERIHAARLSPKERADTAELARRLVLDLRKQGRRHGGIDQQPVFVARHQLARHRHARQVGIGLAAILQQQADLTLGDPFGLGVLEAVPQGRGEALGLAALCPLLAIGALGMVPAAREPTVPAGV